MQSTKEKTILEMSKIGFYPEKEIIETLKGWIKEWLNDINSCDGLSGSIVASTSLVAPQNTISIKVNFEVKPSVTLYPENTQLPFQCDFELIKTEKGLILYISSSKLFSEIKNSNSSMPVGIDLKGDENIYEEIFKEIVLPDNSYYNENYIHELLTQRFTEYFKSEINRLHQTRKNYNNQ